MTTEISFTNSTFSEKKQEAKTMFYSQCLLSSKGPLGAIWVAGYFFKRLNKRQITETDISSSVDKILLEGLPSVTYRILAYLLLGVVRIYSKKVDFLFQDCHDTVSDINKFSVGKKVVTFRNIVRPTPSIILPERYELDSFQMEAADDAYTCEGNIARSKDITLRADGGNAVFFQNSLDKQHFEEFSTLCENVVDSQTSHGDTMLQEICSLSQTPYKVTAEQETSTSAHTPPEKVLSPHQMALGVAVSSPDHIKNIRTSKEKLRGLRFTGEDDMDIDRIYGLDAELINLINDYQDQTNDTLDDDYVIKEAPLENNEESPTVKEKEESSLAEKTNVSETADAGVGNTPEIMVVPTPVKKENTRRLGKRKCFFDETTILSNEIMKQSLKDASNLVCKRRKAPHTVIDMWRFHYIPALAKKSSVPLIPCVALDLEYIACDKKAKKIEPSTQLSQLAIQDIETELSAPTKQSDAATPGARADSRSTIAPGTPVQCPTSARVFGSARAGVGDSEGEGAHFYENIRKEFCVHEEDSPGPSFTAEVDANEADSRELQKNKKGGLSAKTRTVARYLRRIIQSKKRQGVETITLLPIVEHKTRRENAILFFELLVLSSGGLIKVVQERAYGDVLLQETPQLEATLNKC